MSKNESVIVLQSVCNGGKGRQKFKEMENREYMPSNIGTAGGIYARLV